MEVINPILNNDHQKYIVENDGPTDVDEEELRKQDTYKEYYKLCKEQKKTNKRRGVYIKNCDP